MASDVLETVTRLGRANLSGVHLTPTSTEVAIRQLQLNAVRDLGEEVPQSYIALLRLTNGLQVNCAYFKNAENFVPENLDFEYDDVIIVGNDSMAQFVFDKRDKQFHTINMGFPDERFSSYGTFEEMLTAVLKEQQVI